MHSGDWKVDETPTIPPLMDVQRLQQLGEEGKVIGLTPIVKKTMAKARLPEA